MNPSSSHDVPRVAIVGRQNVGKSSLLNALARRHAAIVHRTPGVTRDLIPADVRWNDRMVRLIDTGGLAPVTEDPLHEAVRRQVLRAIEGAALVLFVVDARAPLTAGDRDVAALLRRCGAPVLLVANKVDTGNEDLSEAYTLGFGDPVAVSAAHRKGLDRLRGAILARLPAAPAGPEPARVRLAIVGRRNVGKSSFVNAVAGEERVIVSEIPGTTRDSVDVRVDHPAGAFVLVDTAGAVRRGRAPEVADEFAASRMRSAMRRADVVLFLLDAVERVTILDKEIADELVRSAKPVVLVVNKSDLIPKEVSLREYHRYLRAALPLLDFAPVRLVSARTGAGIAQTLRVAARLAQVASRRAGTGEVNRAVRAILDFHPPPGRGGRQPKMYYAAQVATAPPAFRITVNDPGLFAPDYLRRFERLLRRALKFDGVPLRLSLTARRRKRRP
jgi:GTP-binding protein